MANVAKYSAGAVGHLLAHFERRRDADGEYVRYGNREIDPRRTPLNYRLWPPLGYEEAEVRGLFISQATQDLWDATGQDPEEPALERWRRRYHGVEHAKRKDLVSFCCWAISLPDPIPLDKADAFFDICLRYCIRKYGAKNIVGAWAHWDEAGRPHLHLAFVPVATGADGSERICAKDVLNRPHLSSWHGGLQAAVSQDLGIPEAEVGVLNGRTVREGGNRSVRAIKASEKAFQRGRGRELDAYEKKGLKALREAEKRGQTKSLDNMLIDAKNRQSHQLKPVQRTLGDKMRGW